MREIEKEFDVEVLWAIESGSRAWGFESPDSDFDVRFIYKHKPDFYLALDKGRDVIELPIDETWDVSGWDLDKTLKLLFKSNPTLFEWLQSPIVYHQTDFIERIRQYAQTYFSEKKCSIIISTLPKVICKNTCLVNRSSLKIFLCFAPYFGLSLD